MDDIREALRRGDIRAAAKAADGLESLADIFASAEYRAHLAQVYTKRALARASGRL